MPSIPVANCYFPSQTLYYQPLSISPSFLTVRLFAVMADGILGDSIDHHFSLAEPQPQTPFSFPNRLLTQA